MGRIMRFRVAHGQAQQFAVLPQQKMIGHPRNVIADDAVTRLDIRQLCIALRHPLRVFREKQE